MPEALPIDQRFTIPGEELEVTTARSSGPGGQHVQTTDSRVRLRWRLSESTVLPEVVKKRLVEQVSTWVTREGDLVLTSDQHRSQHMNLEEVRTRLADAVRRALVPPKRRHATRPTRSSQERRMKSKKERSEVKAGRGRHRED